MSKLVGAVFASFCLIFAPTTVSASDRDRVLIGADGVTVTRGDLDQYLQTRVPEAQRAQALSQDGAVRELIAQLYIIRTLAREAQSLEGLDREAIRWQEEHQRDRIYMDALMQKRIAEAAEGTEWEAVAREHYTANRNDFEQPERVRVSHILIRRGERNDDEALALAEKIAERARGGEEFAALAMEYSEDPSAANNQGDLGFFARGRMVAEFEEAAFALENEGDIAGPVSTPFGYHIIRFQERHEARLRPFERVKDSIIRDLRQRQASEVRQAEVERVRAAEGIVVDHEAVEALEAELRVDVGAMIREHREQRGAPQGE